MKIRVLMLDSQKMFVDGMKCYLSQNYKHIDLDVSCTSYSEALEVLKGGTVDLILLDLNIPDMDGISVIKDIRSKKLKVPTMILSSYTDAKFVRSAMLAGADGFVSKNSTYEECIEAIERVVEGDIYIGEGLSTTPVEYDIKNEKNKSSKPQVEDSFILKNRLTQRETEILTKITEGKSNKQIGLELYISDQTVGVHRKNIMKKLGLSNTVKLIKFAIENQLV